MINPYFFLGKPLPFKDICHVYPPSINEVMDNVNYPLYKKLLLVSGEDIEDDFVGIDNYGNKEIAFDELPSPLEYIFMIAATKEEIKQIICDGFEFFFHEPVMLLMDLQMILVGELTKSLSEAKNIDDLRLITQDDFFELQNLMRQAIGEKELSPYDPYEHPKIKYFKAKARQRDKVKAQSKDGLTLGSTLATICCMDLNLNPLNVGELSQCAISVLTRYYQEKDKYDTDIRSLLAGADSKKIKPKYWIRNIEDL